MNLRRYLPVIAGVVFAFAGGSALFAWLLPPSPVDPWASEATLPPIPERAPRKRRAAHPTAAPVGVPVAAHDCATAPAAGTPPTRPHDPQTTMLEPCPGGTRP